MPDLKDIKELNGYVTMSWAMLIFIVVVASIGAWYISDVHTRFQLQNEKIQGNKSDIVANKAYLYGRINTKHEQQTVILDKFEQRLKDLEKPNTDK